MRWRFRGSTPSPDTWAQSIWAGVLAQYLIVARAQEVPIGLVLAYRASFQDGYAYVAAAHFSEKDRSPLMMFGTAYFLRYVFSCWNFRKLYMETSEYNFEQFRSGAGKLFEIEGRMRDHSFFSGRYWDELILSISREAWEREGPRLLDAAESTDPVVTARIRVPGLPTRR
jgi:hypothetical protein